MISKENDLFCIELNKKLDEDLTDSEYSFKVNHNKALVERYPFLQPRSNFTGLYFENYDYLYTLLDDVPDGWRIAFGLEMCEEIRQALLKEQEEDPNGGYRDIIDDTIITPYLKGYRLLVIKEKYGRLRWSDCGAPESVRNIVSKYEQMSEHICITCGQPAKWYTTGWIMPICEDCRIKDYSNEKCEPIEEVIDD